MVAVNLESRPHIYKNVLDEAEIIICFRDYTYWCVCVIKRMRIADSNSPNWLYTYELNSRSLLNLFQTLYIFII